eukprot:PhF_6_TR12268/c0_g1_i1/m.19442/K01593/DDC; aromatic-L-amino-acid decarboxylase
MSLFFASSSFGTTGTVACDDLDAIGDVCKEFGIDYNIDAAYGGAVAICPELRPLLKGLEKADYFICNGSKWLPVLFNTSLMFFKDRSSVVSCLNATGVYLDNKATEQNTVIDFKDYHLGLGRPFRSLKLFTTIRSMGLDGMRDHVRRTIALTLYVDRLMRTQQPYCDLFEILTETRFTLICFRLRGVSEDISKTFLEEITEENHVFLVHTEVPDKGLVLRWSIMSPLADEAQLERSLQYLALKAKELLSKTS